MRHTKYKQTLEIVPFIVRPISDKTYTETAPSQLVVPQIIYDFGKRFILTFGDQYMIALLHTQKKTLLHLR